MEHLTYTEPVIVPSYGEAWARTGRLHTDDLRYAFTFVDAENRKWKRGFDGRLLLTDSD